MTNRRPLEPSLPGALAGMVMVVGCGVALVLVWGFVGGMG